MNGAAPTVDEERRLVAAARAHVLLPRTWRRSKPITRVTFFILTLLGVGAFVLLLEVFGGYSHVRVVFSITAVVAIATGELLIRTTKMFGAGPEEALWICGTMSIAAVVIDMRPSLSMAIYVLIVGVALALAGLRLRNALFVTAALLCLLPWVFTHYSPTASAAVALLLALAATVVSLLPIRRPSSQSMLDVTMVVMPLAAFVCLKTSRSLGWSMTFDALSAGVFATLAAMFAFIGLRYRMHAPLVAAMPCAAIVAWECRNLTSLPLEARLLIWGTSLLVASVVAERLLRGRNSGITSDAIGTTQEASLFDVAAPAMAGMQVHTAGANQGDSTSGLTGTSGGRDSFGGAGASGEY